MEVKSFGVRKVLLSVISVLTMTACSALPIMASGLQDVGLYEADVQERSLLDEINWVSDITYTRVRNAHLNYGSIELMKVSPTRARIGATTQAHHTCPEIWMDIYVDKYDPDTQMWNQWRYWEYSTTNNDHLTKNMEIIVQSGYYYSVRGYHSCRHGEVLETATTMTDGLYIGITDKPVL